MKRLLIGLAAGGLLCLLCSGDVDGRGFGGYRAGGFGYRAGGFGGYHAASWGGFHRNVGYGGWGGARTSYARSYTGWRGGSVNVAGTRGVGYGPRGGFAAGGSRAVSVTSPGGRSYTGYRHGGVAVGPRGRVVGGGSSARWASGGAGWRSAYAGTRFATDLGLSRYAGFRAGGFVRGTTYWSHGAIVARAGYVRRGFGYFNCFHPGWFNRYPGCWVVPGWGRWYAWNWATWPVLAPWINITVAPIYYDYGSNVIYQNNIVYVNGEDMGTTTAYAKQAITLADDGITADASPEQKWKPLGVFALVPGDEKTSNNIFQLAVNKQGIIRGNYYDGVMDTNTPVYGSVDKKTQRAAWTIGKKSRRVFEAGIFNLTKPEAPVLVHFGTGRTEQWLLVRVEKPKEGE